MLCSGGSVQAGGWLDCQVGLNSPNVPEVAHLAVSSSSPDVKVPASMITRPGQTQLGFMIYAQGVAGQQNSDISVQFGQTIVKTTIAITPAGAPVLVVPDGADTVFGKELRFSVSAVDPGGLTVTLSAQNLPAQAVFDAGTGQFSWTPAENQQGSYNVTFVATNSLGASSNGQVTIHVDSGKPIVTDIRNTASQLVQPVCGPNGLATLWGRWLSAPGDPVTDSTGTALALNGAKVKVNDAYVPLVYAAQDRVDFVCPNVAAGTRLNLSVETDSGAAEAVQTVMNSVSPALFSMDGSGGGQGAIVLSGTSLTAMARNYLVSGQPAQIGDAVAIRATGIDPSNWQSLSLKIGGLTATITSVDAIPGMAGVYQITATVPYGVSTGDAIPVTLGLTTGDASRGGGRAPGVRMAPADSHYAPSETIKRGPPQHRTGSLSNTVTMAIEASSK